MRLSFPSVLRWTEDLKVLDPVVQVIIVHVIDMLIREQLAS